MKCMRYVMVCVMVSCRAHYVCSQTFMRQRPMVDDSTLILFGDSCFIKNFGMVVPVVSRSVHPERLAKYFFPGCTCLRVRDADGDIAPEWIGLQAPLGETIDSVFYIRPRQVRYGALLALYAPLVHDSYCGMRLPIITVHNNLYTGECRAGALGIDNQVKTVTDALNQSSWQYGKWCSSCLKKTGVDDIELCLGWRYVRERCAASPYVRVVVPTGSCPCARYVFEPLVGSNHAGLGGGLWFSYAFYQSERSSVQFLTLLNATYRFSACEKRSFDLCPNGNWSRYLLVVKQGAAVDPIDGINVCTQSVNVSPRWQGEFLLNFYFKRDNYGVRLGYDLWARAAEKLCLCHSTINQYGIFNIRETAEDGTTASAATINVPPINVPEDSTFRQLALTDINLGSAGQKRSITNKFFVGVQAVVPHDRVDTHIGISGAYEKASGNSVPSSWSLWGTVAFNF